MPLSFQFEPYVGMLPIKLGMNAAEVAAVAGPPAIRRKNWKGTWVEYRGTTNEVAVFFGADTDTAREIQLAREAQVSFRGTELFQTKAASGRRFDLLSWLYQQDTNCLTATGTVVFLNLGLALSGFTGEAKDQDKSITSFARGAWDKHSEEMTPAKF